MAFPCRCEAKITHTHKAEEVLELGGAEYDIRMEQGSVGGCQQKAKIVILLKIRNNGRKSLLTLLLLLLLLFLYH